MYDVIIKNAFLFDEVKEDFLKRDLAIKNGIIAKIGLNLIDEKAKIIDAENKVLIPGYINTHIHFGEYFVKGYDGNLSTEEYIKYTEKFNYHNEKYAEQIRQNSTLITATEALSFGCTTLVGIRGWNCIDQFGIRLYFGYPLMKSRKLKGYLNNLYQKFEKLKCNELQEKYIFIHSLQMVDEKILEGLEKYLEKNKVKLAIHLSETKIENSYAKKKYGLTPTEVLLKYNLLSQDTLLIHCCYLSERDIEIISNKKASICLCPNSNLKLGNNIPNPLKLMSKGINVCVGTDGIATDESMNILDNCKTLALKFGINTKVLLEMITINPQKYLNSRNGYIKEGYEADLLIYELDNYQITRNETFYNDLIYSYAIKPQYVFIKGKEIISNYKNVKVHLNKINNLKLKGIIIYK
ncbi:MAG: amidohydrolase family protein [Mollicutes bacterium]|nr:amidohydrolase family protein [Mollicutes bacterium]